MEGPGDGEDVAGVWGFGGGGHLLIVIADPEQHGADAYDGAGSLPVCDRLLSETSLGIYKGDSRGARFNRERCLLNELPSAADVVFRL